MVTQEEIQWEVNWAIERLAKGQPVSETIMEAHGEAGRLAFPIVQQWEQTSEGKQIVQAGESAKIESRRLGFTSVEEYRQVQGMAGRPMKPPIPVTEEKQTPTYNPITQTYTTAEGEKMSMRAEDVPFGTKTAIETRTDPYLIKEKVDTFTKAGKEIPVYKTFYVDPTTKEKREATTEERQYLKEQTSYVQAKTEEHLPRGIKQIQSVTGVPILPLFQDITNVIPKLPSQAQEIKEKIISSEFVTTPSPILSGIKTKFQEEPAGRIFLSPVTSQFIPTTPIEVGVIGTAVATSITVPIAAPVIAGGFGVLGAKQVIDPSTTAEQKIAGGLLTVAGGTGAVAGGIPYIRGLKAQTIGRVTGEFKSVKIQPEGFKAVQIAETRIGLIPEKAPLKTGITRDIPLPKVSPLKRGAFGVKPSEKVLFLGEQTVATSQRGLFETGKVIQAKGEFFVTPQEPFLKIAETRISRLGIAETIQSPKDVKLGFGIPEKAQIGIEVGAVVTRAERKGAYRIGTGTELEAIKTSPQIKVEEKLGVTTIRGQAVDIYRIKTGRTKRGVEFIKKEVSTGKVTTISTEGLISTLGIGTARITTATKPSIRISTPTKTPSITTKGVTSISTPTKYISKRTAPTTTITTPTTTISPPTFPSITPPTKPPRTPLRFKTPRQPKTISPRFTVFERRFGKFRTIGTGLSLARAYQVGEQKVRRGLGATFMIKGEAGAFRIKTPKGFYVKPTKKGTLFIEKPKYRLDLPTEIKEIQIARKKRRRR